MFFPLNEVFAPMPQFTFTNKIFIFIYNVIFLDDLSSLEPAGKVL